MELNQIVTPLLTWYDINKRDLPWRKTQNPYYIWISEIMLQQTRVEAVKRYYHRFLTLFPTIEDFANADEDAILKAWEGLGYYARVRNMQLAAKTVVTNHGGIFPNQYDAILTLKGIGPYTAGAIASICFNEHVAAIDGNVLRVLSRICMDDSDIADNKTKEQWKIRLEALEINRSGDFNQALMEIGACVCVPNDMPKCSLCPLASYCKAHQQHIETHFPVKKIKIEKKLVEKTLLWIIQDHQVLIQKRTTALLKGLFEPYSIDAYIHESDIYDLADKHAFQIKQIIALNDIKHIFTHLIWYMKGYVVYVEHYTLEAGQQFVSSKELKHDYAIPSAFRKHLQDMDIYL